MGRRGEGFEDCDVGVFAYLLAGRGLGLGGRRGGDARGRGTLLATLQSVKRGGKSESGDVTSLHAGRKQQMPFLSDPMLRLGAR